MDADPDQALLVLHQVDVVVARADRAQLRLRQLDQLPLRREVGVADLVQHRMVDPLGRRHAHAERDPACDLAHQHVDAAQRVEVGPRQVRASGLVAAADVVADTRRGHVALVGDAAADRLAVARVMVGAEHAEVGVARLHASLELLEAPLVDGAKGLDLHRASPFIVVRLGGFGGTDSSQGCDGRSEARTQGAPMLFSIGATEDAASGRAARPGGTDLFRQTLRRHRADSNRRRRGLQPRASPLGHGVAKPPRGVEPLRAGSKPAALPAELRRLVMVRMEGFEPSSTGF